MDMGKKPLGTETRAPKTEEAVPAANEAPVQPMAVKEKKHYQSKRFVLWRTVVILLLITATALVVAGWFYTQDLYTQLNQRESEIAELKSNNDTASDSKLAGKDLAPQSAIGERVQEYLYANESYSGKFATHEYEIKYMDDTFARVDILETDALVKDKKTVVATFFLKNVPSQEQIAADDTNHWVLIWTEATLTAANKEYLKNTFSVTDEVFTAIREQ